MSTPEQHRPPVYACAAGAVLHAHSADTLEPAVVLYTFLPAGAGDRLDALEAKVDVHGDGPGSQTLTLRVLSDGQSLSWQLPIAPFVAVLPGQPGDDGRMVLMAVMDAEPEEGFWARPVDCERLAAELQIPVTDLVDALRGRLTPWLADDVDLMLHDDAHEHAADQSPAQTLALAVVAHYRGDLEAEHATSRLLRGFEYAPKDYQAELGARLCGALANAVAIAGEQVTAVALEQTGPFEPEVTRLLTELPPRLPPADAYDYEQGSEAAADVVLSGPDTNEAIRAAVAVVARLARAALGPDLPGEQVLRRLGMVSDASMARLAALWVDLAVAASGPTDTDSLVASELAARVEEEGAPAALWLRSTAAVLASYALELAGRTLGRLAAPLQGVEVLLGSQLAAGAPMPADLAHAGLQHCLSLARYVRTRGAIGPGDWRNVPVESAAQAVGAALARGLASDSAVDLLDQLLAEDVEGPDLLDVFVCAVAQVLVEVDPQDPAEVQRARVEELVASASRRAKGGDWLMLACLREAPKHDQVATDLGPYLPPGTAPDPDKLAHKAGRRGMLTAGLACLEAFGAILTGGTVEAGLGLSREELFGVVLPGALIEHEVLDLPPLA